MKAADILVKSVLSITIYWYQMASSHPYMPSNSATWSVADIRQREAAGLAQGLPLMQRAGQAIADFVCERLDPPAHIVALVGPGNNGGDALVAAHLLHNRGYRVCAVMPRSTANLPEDAKQAIAQWLASGHRIERDLPVGAFDAVLDGFFGIGLGRPLEQPWQSMIDAINHHHAPVLAIDIPSGLDADSGQPLGRPVKARWTLALIAPTHALSTQTAQPFVGECHVATLGLLP
jgi:hydroxyethylthiazole kinase-like uncharacterized protein yjeF